MSENLGHIASKQSGLGGFIRRQLLDTNPPIPPVTFGSRTAIVTGSNSGLGYECARQLLSLHLSRLIIAVRSQTEGDEAAKALQESFPDARIHVWVLDMAEYSSILNFARRCEALERIDVVILNAGLEWHRYERAGTGHEMLFQVNYLSTMLLGILLIPILRKSRADGPAHLTFVGSDLAYSATWKIDLDKAVFETADDPKKWKLWIPYPQSKLFLLMGASMLSKRVSCDDVIINVANPGMTRGTSLMANMEQSWQVRLIRLFMKIMGRPVETGARQHIHAVVTGPETHGSFLSEAKIKPFPSFFYTEEGQSLRLKLWNETLDESRALGIETGFLQEHQ